MIVEHARVSGSLPFFDRKFQRRHGLRRHRGEKLPVVQVGCLGQEDFDFIQKHSSDVILVWCGKDIKDQAALSPEQRYMFRAGVHHVAISNFIEASLNTCGTKYKKVPVNFTPLTRFAPSSPGLSVYVYAPEGGEEKYGWNMAQEVLRELPGTSVFRAGLEWSPKDMIRLYKRMFIGLRLLDHDGLSNTVVELGLTGRRCVWNGDTPNAIPYKNMADVVAAIKAEQESPPDPEKVAAEMRAYLDIGRDWLDTEYYND